MADYTKFITDILKSTQNIDANLTNNHNSDVQWETEILKTVQDIRDGVSQSNARDMRDDRRNAYRNGRDGVSNEYGNLSSSSFRRSYGSSGSFRGITEEFKKGLSKGLMDALGMSDFKNKIADALNNLAKSAGLNIQDLPQEFGRQFMRSVIGNSRLFSGITNSLRQRLGGLGDRVANWINGFAGGQGQGGSSGVGNVVNNVINRGQGAAGSNPYVSIIRTGSTAGAGAAGAGAAGAGAGVAGAGGVANAAGIQAMAGTAAKAASKIHPVILLIYIAIKAIQKASVPAVESIKKFTEKFSKAWNRAQEVNKKNAELATERRKKDMEAILEEPFKILESSAEKVWQVWDETLKIITTTQGYTKEALQDLMAIYGERLKSEGLTKYVNAASIQSNLAKVLEAGLSGAVAEEFAYTATKLGALIPTQDSFGYASSYSSLAKNQMLLGKSQSEAIAYANEQLELFASDILYASRQLAGGFSTGLKDASSIFASATQIARAAKTNDPSLIGGVLTSISAIIGAVAPELSTTIVDKVVSTALGGNESSLVALRSLTGLNASNTEFLNMLARNPQQIFYKLFSGLGRMQNMSNDAYMEVAEGLSSVFGIDMKALASVDFQYLANNIRDMKVDTKSLKENLDLVLQGQTTTQKEQMENDKINQMIIEEGLSYTLDSEIARTVWKNMKDEQIARELEQNTYSVEIVGTFLEMVQGIAQTVKNLAGLLNPLGFLKKMSGVVQSIEEGIDQQYDLEDILERGKVGSGSRAEYYNLTSRNKNLSLVSPLLNMMGGYSYWQETRDYYNDKNNTLDKILAGIAIPIAGAFIEKYRQGGYDETGTYGSASSVYSTYKWGTVSKSQAQLARNITQVLSGTSVPSTLDLATTATQASKSGDNALRNKVEQLLSQENIKKYVDENKGYDALVADVNKAANGITDFEKTLESMGYEVSDVKQMFEESATEKGVVEELRRRQIEEDAWNAQINVKDFIKGEKESLISHINEAINRIDIVMSENGYMYSWYLEWQSYIASKNHAGLGDTTLAKLKELQESEKKEDREGLMYKLAEILTKAEGDDLQDPSVQTNIILAEILILLKSAMNQGTRTGGLSLPDTLAALALGIVKQTP